MTIPQPAWFTCDALALMERLPSASATLLYLDPPWATGLDTNSATTGELTRYLAKVVQQARRLLNDSGSVFVHWSQLSPIDLRLMVSQVFGRSPSYEVTWHLKRPAYVSGSSGPRVDNELLLVYSKTNDPIYNPASRPLSGDEVSPFVMQDDRGPFRTIDLTTPGIRQSSFTWRGYSPPTGRSWRYTPDKLEALVSENRIHFTTQSRFPRLKQYLSEHAGVEISVTWDDIPAFIPPRQRVGGVLQRPVALMERIIQIASNTGDQFLDPFGGSGSSVVAAHHSGRRWWGCDNDARYRDIVIARLSNECSLGADDYALISEPEVIKWPVVFAHYNRLVESVADIAKLQQEVKELTDNLISLKKLMNIGENETERVEEALSQMQHWISTSIAREQKSVDSYIEVVCSWLMRWDLLDKASQSFLPQAELLYDNIVQTGGKDYSPFIIQYCRALENELLTKLFAAYTEDCHTRHTGDVASFLAIDLRNDKTGMFAKSVLKGQVAYTLGQMTFNMSLLKADGKTLEGSPLLQDFRGFVIRYFTERIVDKTYLDQIDRINQDFRTKAAHPYLLDSEVAGRCRDQVRQCLNEFILNYRGAPKSDN